MQQGLTTPSVTKTPISVLSTLRAVHPDHSLTIEEALHVAELQANVLLDAMGVHAYPVPTATLEALPGLRFEYWGQIPTHASGASDWDTHTRSWVILLNPHEPLSRIRLTTYHEYKHILDYGQPPLNADSDLRLRGRPLGEYVADYFAGSVLMPERLIRQAWLTGLQSAATLAAAFEVTDQAMLVRLTQLSLAQRVGQPVTPPSAVGNSARRMKTTQWPKVQAA